MTKKKSTQRITLSGCALLVIVAVILVINMLNEGTQISVPLPLNTPAETTAASSPATAMQNGPAETWWEIYFTDPQNMGDPKKINGSIEEKLIQYINNAKESIHIAAFEFDLPLVADALIAAHKRGVEVQWLTDNENGIQADIDDGLKLFPKMKRGGVEIKDDGRSGLMHNKFWIFDQKTVWTGATNITVNGIFKNNNNAIVIHNAELAAIYERQFSDMWNGELGAKAPSTPDQQTVQIGNTSIQVLFSPEDKAMSYLVPLVKNAKKQIRFMAFSFTQEDLGDAVLNRAKAKVDVMGIFETRGSEDEASELCPLYRAKIPVRQDTNSTSFHHKVFVIDGSTTVTGSLNFSENADSSNNENVLIIRNNPQIAARYLAEFETRWPESVDPKASDMQCK